MPRGGFRPTNPGGRPKGRKNDTTLSKEQAREVVRQMVMEQMRPMIHSQMAHARGIGHLFTRDDKGKFSRIEDEAKALELLEHGTEGKDFYIYMKDPSVQAFTDLMNRCMDKPAEQKQVLEITGELSMVLPRLVNGRKRISGKV